MSAILTIGLNSKGERVSIEEVSKGKKCGCFCPICNQPLIAKNSVPLDLAKREHHFAHEKGILCGATDETYLHQLAKEVIIEEKAIMLPPSENRIHPSGLVRFKSVENEKWDEKFGFRPDVDAITDKGERIIIEFYVTHKISWKKRNIITSNKLHCVEIDLNYVKIDKDEIRSFLLKESEERKWVEDLEKTEWKGGGSYYFRNPLHAKVVEHIKELFTNKNLRIGFKTISYNIGYNLSNYGYDICEPLKLYRNFKSDLMLYRSQYKDKGFISISVRSRRRNDRHKIPRNLRVIDIIIREEKVFNQLLETDTLSDDCGFVIFEGFKNLGIQNQGFEFVPKTIL